MRTIHVLAALPLTCLFAATAMAQTPAPCTKQLSMIEEIHMTSRGSGPASVPVEINGQKQSLTLATAGIATQLTEATAKSLGLSIVGGSEIALLDREGRASGQQVIVKTFTLGKLEGSDVKIPISVGGGGRDSGGGAAGLLSLNHMLPYDMDVDFGTDTLRFFSQDHCPGGVLYWQAKPVGVMPITIDKGRVTVPVEIDGKALTGVIDTAATGLTFKEAVAEKILGLEAGSEGKTHTGTLHLGTIGLRNINFRIMGNGAIEGGSAVATARNRSAAVQNALAQPEVVIGMDLLRKLHLYMAFGEQKLYVTPASSKPAADTAAAAPPAR